MAHRINYYEEITPFLITAESKTGDKNIIYKSEHVESTRAGLRDFTLMHLAALYPMTAGGISVVFGVPLIGYSVWRLYDVN